MENQWLLDRCIEVRENPDGYIDLWSREHYKSTIITYGLTIQDILRSHGEDPIDDRECLIGIFSHTRPIAKKFLFQIQQELQSNEHLKRMFPDVLYMEPERDAPKWSLDSGLIVRRRGNPKEATVEAWGLVDGQPTGSHFTHLIYDDVVTLGSVTTPEMIQKTTDALAVSYNLGSQNGFRRRFIGTRYHFNDSYRTVMERGTAEPRIYPASKDGTLTGEPVFWDPATLATKVRDMGPYVAACQLMQNPRADTTQGFRREWLRFFDQTDGAGMNIYILVDPAHSKKKDSDYTVFSVIGLGADNNYYRLQLIRDRLNLSERTKVLFDLHRKWRPKMVGYERYGAQSDIEHMQEQMASQNYRFPIAEVAGKLSKPERIKRLIPVYAEGRFYIPAQEFYTAYDGKVINVTETFINDELLAFPVAVHDDALDADSRIFDLDVQWPKFVEPERVRDRYTGRSHDDTGYMAL